ncbi:MAG: AsmA-like C-terminal region-containing protein [Burkholderiales bacterium]
MLSGRDRLADGTLRVQLVDGQLYLGPAEVNLPGGTAKLSLVYDPTKGGVELAAGAYIERFDYGILARRRRSDSDVTGLFSLNLELTGKAPSLNAIMGSADGRIDLAVWPKNLGAGQIDLWVVNLFRELLPVLDRGQVSVVNCVVGRFDLAGGKLTRDALVIDTSRMRVLGAGGVDFATEAIDFRFQPRAKDVQFFSLETPVSVTGTFTDFDIGVSPGDVLATIARFLGSVVVVPLETLFRGPLPRDGGDVCDDPLRAVGAPRR